MVSHSRRVYGIFDLLGELGGVMEVMVIIFGLILYPISEHNFYLNAIKKLFFARTDDNDIFVSHLHNKKGKESYQDCKKGSLERKLIRQITIKNRISNE